MKTTDELKAAIREKIALLQSTLRGIEVMEADSRPAFKVRRPEHSLGRAVEDRAGEAVAAVAAAARELAEHRAAEAAEVSLADRIDDLLIRVGTVMDVNTIVASLEGQGVQLGPRGDTGVRNTLRHNAASRGWGNNGPGLWFKIVKK